MTKEKKRIEVSLLLEYLEREMRRLCYVQARSVNRLQVDGGYVWAQFAHHMYRAALSDLR